MKSTLLLTTDSWNYFAEKLFDKLKTSGLNVEIASVIRKSFKDGEQYRRVDLDERLGLMGRDVIYVDSLYTDWQIEEQYRVGCALAKLGNGKRIFANPFMANSTMERASKPNEVVTFKTIARKFSSIPKAVNNYFLMLDLHVAGSIHYFEGDCTPVELYAEPVLVQAVKDLIQKKRWSSDELVFASADLSRLKWVKTYAKKFGGSLAMVDKDHELTEVHTSAAYGNVVGKKVLMYDDMVRTAKSTVQAAESYYEAGADEVYSVNSHLALTGHEAAIMLRNSKIVEIHGTNSHPSTNEWWGGRGSRIWSHDVTGIYVKAIAEILQ